MSQLKVIEYEEIIRAIINCKSNKEYLEKSSTITIELIGPNCFNEFTITNLFNPTIKINEEVILLKMLQIFGVLRSYLNLIKQEIDNISDIVLTTNHKYNIDFVIQNENLYIKWEENNIKNEEKAKEFYKIIYYMVNSFELYFDFLSDNYNLNKLPHLEQLKSFINFINENDLELFNNLNILKKNFIESNIELYSKYYENYARKNLKYNDNIAKNNPKNISYKISANYQENQNNYNEFLYKTLQIKNYDGLGISSFVLSLCSIFLYPLFILQLLGIIFGIISLSNTSKENCIHRWPQIIGLILGIIYLVEFFFQIAQYQ